jgi:hypothetical protein
VVIKPKQTPQSVRKIHVGLEALPKQQEKRNMKGPFWLIGNPKHFHGKPHV